MEDGAVEVRVERIGSWTSTRIAPVDIDNEPAAQVQAFAPLDSCLPITESRNGNFFSITSHMLSSGIGLQALLLPVAFTSLGWVWGIICLSLLFVWQLYTIWLLVDLHESTTGTRFSRYVHLATVAFGGKMGKLAAIFPTMYLSGGSCVMLIINGGGSLQLFYKTMCGGDPKGLTGAEWFLLFVCIAIFISLFFPNLNSLAWISLLGSLTAIAYCTILWTLSVSKGRPPQGVTYDPPQLSTSKLDRFRDIANALAVISLAFRGHNIILEIQGTLPTNTKVPLRRRMCTGVIASYILIALCHFPLAIAGYWAYGNLMPTSYKKGGILNAFEKFHIHDISKSLMGAIYMIIIIACLCTYQIYALPVLDNWERIYLSKKKMMMSCPKWVRMGLKVLFGGLTYLVSVAFPFLGSLAGFIGSITMPLTFAYPCFMWIAIKKPRPYTLVWCVNMGLGCLGMLMCTVLATATLWNLIADGLHANFFNP
ncbi:PREDICTED: lysine histidine transporter-like 8 [Ipomoea nil]|uniref:lysine histidine transporter-like 8 n=1 Tax=Ipomoea nil TaxID=35883 RepID=UPI000900BB8E|nr:PREDICTED: lysine histidine transporter-like 8 [Ipomoea nil]